MSKVCSRGFTLLYQLSYLPTGWRGWDSNPRPTA